MVVLGEESGSMYKYICVVKRFGGPWGVIQRVKGMRLSKVEVSIVVHNPFSEQLGYSQAT